MKTLTQVPLPAHLIGKLGFEYSNASSQRDASRNAIMLAALYSGAVGPSIDQPWSSLAKAQWLLKAVELGSYATVSSIMRDKKVLRLIEDYDSRLLKVRHHCFRSPDVDLDALLRRLRDFATMPDIDSLNIFVFLGGDPAPILDGEDSLNVTQLEARMEQQHRIRADAPHLFELERFTGPTTRWRYGLVIRETKPLPCGSDEFATCAPIGGIVRRKMQIRLSDGLRKRIVGVLKLIRSRGAIRSWELARRAV